jgi:hypothetical protein
MLCPSIENFCWPSPPALIKRNLCFLPDVNLNLLTPTLDSQGVVSLAATLEQLKLLRPLIRLLFEKGTTVLSSVPTASSSRVKEVAWK